MPRSHSHEKLSHKSMHAMRWCGTCVCVCVCVCVGGYICMHIGYVPRERPPFSALNFRSGAYHFHKRPKNPVRNITILHLFCRSGDHHFQNFFSFNTFTASHGRLSPNAKRSAAPRVSDRPECQPALDASWQFRRPAFSRSTAELVPEVSIFTLDRRARSGVRADFSLCRGTYLTKFGVSSPPPPPDVAVTRSTWRLLHGYCKVVI